MKYVFSERLSSDFPTNGIDDDDFDFWENDEEWQTAHSAVEKQIEELGKIYPQEEVEEFVAEHIHHVGCRLQPFYLYSCLNAYFPIHPNPEIYDKPFTLKPKQYAFELPLRLLPEDHEMVQQILWEAGANPAEGLLNIVKYYQKNVLDKAMKNTDKTMQ